MPFIAVDIGNSCIKYALYENGEPPVLCSLVRGNIEQIPLHEKTITWRIASVNKVRLEALQNWISTNRINDVVKILSRQDVPLRTDVTEPDRVGIDRLLAGYAALQLFGGWYERLLVVDIGTAATIDLVSTDNVFHGGAILPGWETAYKALFANAEQLPNVQTTNATKKFPGRNTTDAINVGIQNMLIGAIMLSQEDSGKPTPPIVLAGGGAERLRESLLEKNLEVLTYPNFPELVINGIAVIDFGN
jgi:type III pantothenate kinase